MTRKFGKAFLTTSAVLVLFINLIVILLYGRQFYACIDGPGVATGSGRSFCGEAVSSGTTIPLIVANGFVVLLLLAIWLSVRFYLRRHHSPSA